LPVVVLQLVGATDTHRPHALRRFDQPQAQVVAAPQKLPYTHAELLRAFRRFADRGAPAGCISPETLERALVRPARRGERGFVHVCLPRIACHSALLHLPAEQRTTRHLVICS
jgi:hypothetical protein